MVDYLELDKDQYDFLHKLYDLTKGSTLKSVTPELIATQLNCDTAETGSIVSFLVDNGLAEYPENDSSGEAINITGKGASMIEGPVHETEN